MSSHDSCSGCRLCSAADAALRASLDVASRTGGLPPHPCELIEAPGSPGCYAGFTRAEIEDACDFLYRAGLLPSARPRARSRRG